MRDSANSTFLTDGLVCLPSNSAEMSPLPSWIPAAQWMLIEEMNQQESKSDEVRPFCERDLAA